MLGTIALLEVGIIVLTVVIRMVTMLILLATEELEVEEVQGLTLEPLYRHTQQNVVLLHINTFQGKISRLWNNETVRTT
jgi:hypothetical protein